MPHWVLHYHLVWATKYRAPSIAPDWEPELYQVMAAKCKVLGCQVYAMGGLQDHVHLALSVPPRLALATCVQQIKGNSSHFVNHVIRPPYTFAWQSEYSIVTFGQLNLDWVCDYIRNQKENHTKGKINRFLEPIDDAPV